MDFAKSIANNIVKYANTHYSTSTARSKVADGVYIRTFQQSEIENSAKEAREKEYEPYNITTETPYLYMVRETGGIATGSYVDGRDKNVR